MGTSGKGRLPVALMDWDGTLRDGWTLPAWMDALAVADSDDIPSAAFNTLANQYIARAIGHDELVREAESLYLDALRPHDVQSVDRIASEFVLSDRNYVRPFAAHLVSQLHRRGVEIFVVSGAPSVVLDRYRRLLPISRVWGLDVVRHGDDWCLQRNTGLSEVKASLVEQISRRHRIVAAFGDSESDAPLLQAAEVPVVVGSGYSADSGSLRLGPDGAGYEEVASGIREALTRPR